MSRRLSTALSATVLASALVLSACGEESASTPSPAVSGVTVTGSDPAKAPTVSVKSPLAVTKTGSQVVTEGTGAAVTAEDLVSIQAVIVNGQDGKVVNSTWETGAVGLDLGADTLFTSFKSQLPGKKLGSRVVITSTPASKANQAAHAVW